MPTVQVSPEADELLQIVANGVLKSRKIIVVTGAGISTNSGIPDFRSENGLYALIQAQFDSANRDPALPTALSRTNSSSSDGSMVSRDDGPPAKRRKLDQTRDPEWESLNGARPSAPQPGRVQSLKVAAQVKAEKLDTDPLVPCQMLVDSKLARTGSREDDTEVGQGGDVPRESSDARSSTLTRSQSSPGSATCLVASSSAHPKRLPQRRNSWGGTAILPGCPPGATSLEWNLVPPKMATEGRSSKVPDEPASLHQSEEKPASIHAGAGPQDSELKTRRSRAASLSLVENLSRAVDKGSGPVDMVYREPLDTPKRTRSASLTLMTPVDVGESSRATSKPQAYAQSPARKSIGNDHPQGPTPGLPRLPLPLLSTGPHSLRLTPKQISHLPFTSSPLSSPPPSTQRHLSFIPRRKASEVHTPSRLIQLPLEHNSSPLSSPPPVLFDPFQQPSSSTSQQSSSAAGSATSSETDETPPSSRPSLVSQTSNPTRSSLPNIKGRDLFDVSIWADPLRTSVFYTFATTLRQKARDVQPTASHLFISHLRDRGKLVRCYTQNIDQIEEKVGLSTSLQQGPGSRGRFSRKSAGGFSAPNSQGTAQGGGGEGEASEPLTKRHDAANGGVECVFLHGSLQSLRCFLCGRVCEWDEGGRSLETLSGRQPECPHCVGATVAREERGKRALGVGKLRPDIVLYGEEHPNAHLIDPLVKHDLALYPDSLLILGTSLKVHGLKVLVREFAKTVHSKGGKVIFVNFTKPPESSWGDIIDYWIQWDCDAWVSNLQERVPLLWLPPGTKLPAPGKRKRESTGESKAAKRRSGEGVVKADVSADAEKLETKQEAEDSQQQVHSCLQESGPKIAPRRPQVMREDKHNAAYLTWQIAKDLRTITGDDTPLISFTTVQKCARLARTGAATFSSTTTLPIGALSRKSLPGGSSEVSQRTPTALRTPLPSASGGALPRTSVPSRTPLPTDSQPAPLKPRSPLEVSVQTTQAPQLVPVQPAAAKKRKRDSRRIRTPLPATTDITVPAAATKKPSLKRQGPGWIYVSVSEDDTEPGETLNEQDGAGQGALGTVGNDTSASIGAAIKTNPRKRRRKIIDGEEVALPGSARRPAPSTPRALPLKGLFKPPSQTTPTPLSLPLPSSPSAPSSGALQGPIHISPTIASDLRRVSMDTVELAPIRIPVGQYLGTNREPSTPPKPVPIEPRSPPSGPLSRISTYMGLFGSNPFRYTDSLINKLRQPPAWIGWTPGPNAQLRSETDAALALGQMRMGS